MYAINSLTVVDGSDTQLFGGLGNDMSVVPVNSQLQGVGSIYILSVVGGGALVLVCEETPVTGVWNIFINNNQALVWSVTQNSTTGFNISIDANGMATFSDTNGGMPMSFPLLVSMQDMDTLLPLAYTMVLQNKDLQSSWASNAMQTLYGMGYPETSMLNMDTNCCMQYTSFINGYQVSGLTLSTEQAIQCRSAIRERRFNDIKTMNVTVGMSFSCGLCQFSVAASSAIIIGFITVAIVASAPYESLLVAVTGLNVVGYLADYYNSPRRTVAKVVVNTFGGGIEVGIGSLISNLCSEFGAC